MYKTYYSRKVFALLNDHPSYFVLKFEILGKGGISIFYHDVAVIQ